jgi:hypothetical protein
VIWKPPNSAHRVYRSESPRLYALVIGINDYQNVARLDGAVSDAKDFIKYLEESMKVPPNRIRVLLDKQASRSAIIRAFQELQNDTRIRLNDPIVIFYAGHGAELAPPARWEAGGVGRRIQSLVPQNYGVKECVYPIPDRTISALIDGIASKKGDNIVSYIHSSLFSSLILLPDGHFRLLPLELGHQRCL